VANPKASWLSKLRVSRSLQLIIDHNINRAIEFQIEAQICVYLLFVGHVRAKYENLN
jgi:hypothetical protein